jgi:hypothetical protein
VNQETNNRRFKVLVWISFVVFTAWWLYINFILRSSDHNSVNNQAFAATYGVMSVFGGVVGLIASKKWGGRKSLIGRALLFFAIGLLAQEFGQLAYSYYLYVLKVEIPYPSIGDIGYFGSVLLYIYAASQLLKATGARFSLKNRSKKVIAVALPLILLAASYAFFLRDYQFDFSSSKSTLTVLLDFGYPLGQATYIAIALLTYLLSRNLLGGIMKKKILFVLFALVIQYVADFSFLDAARANKVFPAGANDYVYLVAYTVMALALSSFRINLSAESAQRSTDKKQEDDT